MMRTKNKPNFIILNLACRPQKVKIGPAYWYRPIIPALGRWKQED
jgi:hypothetical protein